MRDIRFRAWDTKEGHFMFPWPEGFALFGETTCFDLMGQQFKQGEDRLLRYNDLVVMQYTGLKDKNGQEIYEGDIFQDIDGSIYYCAWGGSYFAFYQKTEVEGSELETMPFNLSGLVIGNIYENPELIKDGKE